MSTPQRPQLPPQVLRALQSGNKLEAIKLLREAAKLGLAEAKSIVEAGERAGAGTKTQAERASAAAARGSQALKPHPMAAPPHLARRPGLSPGEVPDGGGSGFAWIVLVFAGLIVAYSFLG